MSALSLVTSPPAPSQDASSKPVKPASAAEKPPREDKAPPAPEPHLLNKTKVKTEQRTKFSFTYTFIDAETQRVIGQWPEPSRMGGYDK